MKISGYHFKKPKREKALVNLTGKERQRLRGKKFYEKFDREFNRMNKLTEEERDLIRTIENGFRNFKASFYQTWDAYKLIKIIRRLTK